ncbi:MAG: bifunctional diaminohydroxyphosphoribosylaminopyrimidine deaminase/5-amino-6-(5-phosphoribosylamino)uracil reductase RibD [Thermodesulfobacteriota bacterium]
MRAPADSDLPFMRLALREARKGLGRTSPNPCVGAVVVKDGQVIATGYHKKAGTPHAEVHALGRAGEAAAGATIYVSLEPCNHTGKTPPCTKAIIASGIKRVVVGMVDPNPLVAGSGCRYLESQGVEVAGEVLASKCRALNRPFLKHISTGLPWVVMKAGCSLDGKIAVADGRCAFITGPESRQEVHRLRDRLDAILVGVETAINDDPSLTTRLKRGKGRDPVRVVLDSQLRLPENAQMLNQDSAAPTWLFCGPDAPRQRRQALEAAGAKVLVVERGPGGGLDLEQVLARLGENQLNSLLVEGGSGVHTSFLSQGLVDQVSLFLAPLFLGQESIPLVGALAIEDVAQGRRLQLERVKRFGSDVLLEGLFTGIGANGPKRGEG